MEVSVTSEVSWQTKLFKLRGMSPVLSKVGSFCMLFVFCHRMKYSKTRAFSVSLGSYFLPLKIIVMGNFVWSQAWVHQFNFILLFLDKRTNGRRSSISCIEVWRHGTTVAPAVEELWMDSLWSSDACPYKQEICCLLDVFFADLLTDLWCFYFETHPSVSDTCAATALEDYLYAAACGQAVPKAKSRISWQAGDVQGKMGSTEDVCLAPRAEEMVICAWEQRQFAFNFSGLQCWQQWWMFMCSIKAWMARAEWPSLSRAGAAGALQPGLRLCVTQRGHWREMWRERETGCW